MIFLLQMDFFLFYKPDSILTLVAGLALGGRGGGAPVQVGRQLEVVVVYVPAGWNREKHSGY